MLHHNGEKCKAAQLCPFHDSRFIHV
jgi:hypothetical protein